MQYTDCLCFICNQSKIIKIIKEEHPYLSYAICLGKYLFNHSFNFILLKYLLRNNLLLILDLITIRNYYIYSNNTLKMAKMIYKKLYWNSQLFPNYYFLNNIPRRLNRSNNYIRKIYSKKNKMAKYI